jgi:hypothetical protein
MKGTCLCFTSVYGQRLLPVKQAQNTQLPLIQLRCK